MDNRESSSQNLNLTNIKYLSLSQAGEIFNYTRQHLSLLIRLNKLKAVKIGNFYYTTEEWVKDYINNLDKSKTDETKFDPVLKLLKQSLLQRDLSLPIFKIVWTFFILVIGFYLFNYKPIETLAFFSKPQKFLTKAIDLTDKLAYSYIAQVHDLLYLGLDIYKPTNLTDFGETLSANVVTLADNLVASEIMDAVRMRVTTNISEVFSFRALANIKTFFSANKFLDKKDTNHQLEYNLSALIKFINQKINEKNKELEALENSLTLLENKLKIITANQPITTFNFNSDVSSSKSSNITSVGTLSIDRRISDIEASLKILNKRVSPSTSFLEELWIIKQNYANLNSELIQLKNLTEKLQEKQRSIPLPIFAYQAAPVVVSPAANISGIIGAVKNAFEDSSLVPRQIKVGGDLTLSGKNISSLSAILPDSALLTLNGSLIPATTTTYDLGSSSNKWNTIYAQSLAVNGLSSSGQQIITYQPASSSITESSMYINPVSATSTFPLLGVAINGNEKLRVNANGDLTIQGILTIMGSATSTFGGPVLLATTTVSRLTISELTNGSILFAGSGGIISQDNSQLFWDNTNNRLGIGTTTPTERLTVSGNILGTGNLTIQGTTTLGNLNGVLKASSGTVSGGATTSDLPEGTNLYYTDARARSALSGLAPISYNSSTGVISLATPLATQYGGTGQNWSSVATGSLPYFSGTGTLSTLAIGSTNQILTVSSGLPVWTSTPTLATTTITTQLSVPTITTASGALSISPASNATTTISGPTILAGTTGNVGIGTTGPSRKLDILDSTNPQLRLTQTAGTNYADFQVTSNGRLKISPSGNAIVGSGLDVMLGDFALFMHPETSPRVFIPYLTNDLAFNNLRGGSTTLTPAPNGGGNADNLFDGSAAHVRWLNPTGSIVIETTLYKTFTHPTIIGFSSSQNFYAKDFTVEVWDLGTNSWSTVATKTNYSFGQWQTSVNYGSAGFNKIRITFSNFLNSADFRLSEIFAIWYASGFGTEVFLSRGGGTIYGNITTPSESFVGPSATSGVYFKSGNVGIGTTTPAQKLQITGGNVFIQQTAANTPAVLFIEGTGDTTASYIRLRDIDANQQWYLENRAIASNAFVIESYDGTTWRQPFIISSTTPTNTLYLSSTGNVGIGTASPANKLTVAGNADFTGNVGIGTATPAGKLHVVGDIYIDNSAASRSIKRYISGSWYDVLNVGTGSSDITLYGSQGVVLSSTGYGVTAEFRSNGAQIGLIKGNQWNPGSRTLVVRAGSGQTANLFELQNSAGTGLGAIDVNGNLGIGTTGPSEKLTIRQDSVGNILRLLDGANNSVLAINDGGVSIFKPSAFDTVYNFDGSTIYTNNTTEAKTSGGTAFTILSAEASSDDEFYLGLDHKFNTIYFDIATAGAGVTLSAQYWNGAWTALTITDGTNNLTADGTITFTDPSDWATTAVNGVTKYWIRLRSPATNITTAPTAYSVSPTTGSRFYVYGQAGDSVPAIYVNDQGNVGIGTTAPNEKLEVAGRIRMTTWTADGDTAVYRDDPTGNLGLITSDIRLKKDLEAISGAEALGIIRQIEAYKYRDIDADENSKKKYGVIAQELLNLAPELTFTFRNTDSQEEYFSVHYDKLPVLLLAGIKEQQKQIEELKLSINQNGNLTQDGQEVNRQLSTNNSQSIFNDLISKLKDALASLGLFVENGIAKIKEIIAQKITTKEICLEGEDGEKICIDKNQLKELLQKNNLNPSQPNSTSEITPNLYSQPSPTPSLSPSSETTPTTSSESSPSQIPEITPTSTLLSPPEATPTTSPEITPSPSTTIEATSISSPQPLSTPIPQPTSLPEPTFLPSSATAEQ